MKGRVVPLDYLLRFEYGRRYMVAATVVHERGLADIGQVLEVFAIELQLKAALFEATGKEPGHIHDLVKLFNKLPDDYQQEILAAHRRIVQEGYEALDDPDSAFMDALQAIRSDFPDLRYGYESKRGKGGTITTIRATLVARAVWEGTDHLREGLPKFSISHRAG